MGKRFIVGIALVTAFSSGCMIVRLTDKFTLDQRSSNESHDASFYLATDSKIKQDVSRFYFPFVRIDNRRLPHDLVVNLFNQTKQYVGPNLETAVFESIEMVFSDGHRKVLLAADQPRPQRTFRIAGANHWLSKETQVTFAGAVDRADSFVLKCNGTAVSQSGTEIPFETRSRYRYDGKDWDWMTLSQEFGSCGGI